MVWHNDIFTNSWNRFCVLVNYHTNLRKHYARADVVIGPYDGAENTIAVLCTDCNEICAWLAVIEVSQAVTFSFGVHDYIRGSRFRTG